MTEQARFVPNEYPAEDRALAAALEAMAEGCEIEDELVLGSDGESEE